MLEGLGLTASHVEPLPANWHGDDHWRVVTGDGSTASVRAVGTGRPARWEDPRPCGLDLVRCQVRAGEQFRGAGLPFMRLIAGPVAVAEQVLVAFEWLDGRPIERPTRASAGTVGAMLREFHRVARELDPTGLARHSLARVAWRSLHQLEGIAPAYFLERATAVAADLPSGSEPGIVTHGDFNLPNLVWGPDALVGLVDFDQIGEQHAVEELAWVVKWWSRPSGLGAPGHSSELANAVLDSYTPDDAWLPIIAPMLWISGCLNANSVSMMEQAATPTDRRTVADALLMRADQLASLLA